MHSLRHAHGHNGKSLDDALDTVAISDSRPPHGHCGNCFARVQFLSFSRKCFCKGHLRASSLLDVNFDDPHYAFDCSADVLHISSLSLFKEITGTSDHLKIMQISCKGHSHSELLGSLMRSAMRVHRYGSMGRFLVVMLQCYPTGVTDATFLADYL